MLATTPAQIPKGYKLSTSQAFHKTTKIEVSAELENTQPVFRMFITHTSALGDNVYAPINIFCETFAQAEEILTNIANGAIASLVILKMNTNNDNK